jgi:hypothetical protein
MSSKNSVAIAAGFRTSNGVFGSFNVWDNKALESMGVMAGALDPKTWSYHVRGDLYEAPPIAHKRHETGGSINAVGTDLASGNTVCISHVFFIDITGHRNGLKPDHWNYQIYTKIANGEWTPVDKKLLQNHEIPISESITIWAKDEKGKSESKEVRR